MYSRHEIGIVKRYGGRVLGLVDGFSIKPIRRNIGPIPLRSQPIIDDYEAIYDESKFAVPRQPLPIADTSLNFGITDPQTDVNCVSMPIKFPGSEIRVPNELGRFRDDIQAAADFEYAVNSKYYHSNFIYMTIEESYVDIDQHQRSDVIHSDDIQGPAYSPKLIGAHCYIAQNPGTDGTFHYEQPFYIPKGASDTHDLIKLFTQQANRENGYEMPTGKIHLIDAYCVHEGPLATRPGIRDFWRLTTTEKTFVREGNTHNALFDYNWDMTPRPKPENLL